ncbi:MAG: hypothetical protein ACI4XJ_05510 [Eubacteriales bacterium]
MVKENFLTDSAVLRRYLSDADDGSAVYEDYALDGVLVREKYTFDEDEVGGSEVSVYYFPEFSVCRGGDGAECELPKPQKGDCCIIGGAELRIASVSYLQSAAGSKLSHVRLGLR